MRDLECMENEVIIRLGLFAGLFAIFALAEYALPRRKRSQTRAARWTTNLVISGLNTLTLRLMAVWLPLLAVGAAVDARANGLGLFNQISWPEWTEIIIAILIFDFAIWAQHLITHKVPVLWRLHRVHHADRDIDVTTAVRFHPVEIALSMFLKIGIVYAIGPAALAVIDEALLALAGTSPESQTTSGAADLFHYRLDWWAGDAWRRVERDDGTARGPVGDLITALRAASR